MTRILVLGEFRADRLVPPLVRSGAEVTVLGFEDLTGFLDPRVSCGALPRDLTDESLSALLKEHDADIVVPNMSSPGQEQLLTLYARTRGGMAVHSQPFATLACDKVALHRTASRRGWPGPNALVCEGPRHLAPAVERIGLPLIVKEARSESFAGRYLVSEPWQLTAPAARAVFPVLAQQVVSGEEFAVELLTLPGGTVSWPVASLGPLDGECAPGRRARVQPAVLPDAAAAALATVVADIVTSFRPAGPWQIDFAVTADGRPHLIEINGRFGGVSNLSWTSTGTDPHGAHAHAVLHGGLPRQPRAVRVALELPVPNGTLLPAAPAGTELTAFTANPGYPGPYRSGVHKAVLAVPPRAAEAAREWLRDLPPGAVLAPVGSALGQLGRGLDALTSGPASVLPPKAGSGLR
ncbi:hypothetical protein ACSNOK_06400 [Streptomyces sp. URMC 126]|uniref:hypothetical protein n=1 Tax=Streptomyces sp. URMC 126 TaxID=3423401 RepID=UPI003F1E4516